MYRSVFKVRKCSCRLDDKNEFVTMDINDRDFQFIFN